MANNCRQAVGVLSIAILTCMVCFMHFGFQLIFHKQSIRSPTHFCSRRAAANSLLSHLAEANSHFVGASPTFLPFHMEAPPTHFLWILSLSALPYKSWLLARDASVKLQQLSDYNMILLIKWAKHTGATHLKGKFNAVLTSHSRYFQWAFVK